MLKLVLFLYSFLVTNFRSLSDCKLQTLPAGLFANQPYLERIFLDKNEIAELPERIFSNLTRLVELRLNVNRLKEIHPTAFRGLEKLPLLLLDKNKLTSLAPGTFKGLRELQYMILFDNRLGDLHPDSLKGLKKLQLLYLHDNKMNTLPDNIFDEMKDLKRVNLDTSMMCCHMQRDEVSCEFSSADSFANCDRMLKDPAPRSSIWVIGILAILGNAFVIVWRLKFPDKNVVQSIMLINLAIADGIMGIYLIIVAAIDIRWTGYYFKEDFAWRMGLPCKITGSLAILSSEVSVMSLSVLTSDRLINLVYTFRFNPLTRKKAYTSCTLIWLASAVIAFLPVFQLDYFQGQKGHGYYGRSTMCLPLQLSTEKVPGWEFSVAIFMAFNFAAYLFMVVAYSMIFWESYQSNRRFKHINPMSNRGDIDLALALKVFFIILTDFLCWIPIIILGVYALANRYYNPSVDAAIWIAVFVLPINSAINPLLYTFSTQQVLGPVRNKIQKLRTFVSHLIPHQEEQNQAGELEMQEMPLRGQPMEAGNGQAPQGHLLEVEIEQIPRVEQDSDSDSESESDDGGAQHEHQVVVDIEPIPRGKQEKEEEDPQEGCTLAEAENEDEDPQKGCASQIEMKRAPLAEAESSEIESANEYESDAQYPYNY